ncbi:hypothetical protein ACTMS0_26210, partial [Micromonospora sp. H33]
AGRDTGLRCWAFTGPAPNPLADLCDDVLAVPSPDSQVVQELHLVSSHVLCEHVDRALPLVRDLPRVPAPRGRTERFLDSRALAAAGLPSGHGANGHSGNGHGANGHGVNGHGPHGRVNGHDGAGRTDGADR